jgi:type I restriction enzyme S subunit
MNWPSVQLKQITALGPQYGANAAGAPWTGSRPRYIRITDIDQYGHLLDQGAVEADTEDVNEYTLQEGDILFARSGNTVGKTYRHSSQNGHSVFAGYLIRFRLDPQLADSKFVFFFTQSPSYKTWVSSKKRVAGQPNLNGSEYSTLTFPLPALREQRRIVEILEQADALRQKRAEADAIADRLLPALFNKTFGDQVSNQNKWPRKPLGEITAITAAMVDPRKTEYLDLPHVGPDRIESGNGMLLPCNSAREERLISGKYLFNPSHVLYSKIRPYLRKVALPEFSGLCSADMYPVTPLPNFITREFLWALLLSNAFTNYTAEHSGRANMPKLNREQFAAYDCAVPPIELQRWFSRQVIELRQFESKRVVAHGKIETLFATMLYNAFNGELTAQWREAHVKELLAEMEQQARLLRSNPNGRN